MKKSNAARTAVPNSQPPSAYIEAAWFEGEVAKVRFVTHNLGDTLGAWAFIMARGNARWYPSERPVNLGESRWLSIFSLGDAEKFTVYIVILDPPGQAAIESYLAERRADGRCKSASMDLLVGRLPERSRN